MRNNEAGTPSKGLKDGHCNRSGCLRPLAGQHQYWMCDHETFTDARLYYCQPCAHQFDRADDQFEALRRCTPQTDNA
jgi:hypothetical protein